VVGRENDLGYGAAVDSGFANITLALGNESGLAINAIEDNLELHP
jgi:hypothetical protein